MLSSGGFTVLHIYLGLLEHFELIFMKAVRSVSRLQIAPLLLFIGMPVLHFVLLYFTNVSFPNEREGPPPAKD